MLSPPGAWATVNEITNNYNSLVQFKNFVFFTAFIPVKLCPEYYSSFLILTNYMEKM